MRVYEFIFFDAEGRRPVMDISECPDDRQAAQVAFAQLDDHASCRGVEIYEGQRLVGRVERPDDRKRPPATAWPDSVRPQIS
ncbi:hypothetical protein [Brevundimonas sp. PAMC22021]|jgi:hypothetical protein|uniref:hypothetical protein n=1 Tax=Brevundimonas sp. PAMC22021 TaxID=2861285 RepID=UPI001C63A7FB|nr:hypothetical protein [Brevundimonas sp. PAMC22021]QYF87128.1 hypothetical protein KY493_00990 [Brevundimonas sp. PAMC22021]